MSATDIPSIQIDAVDFDLMVYDENIDQHSLLVIDDPANEFVTLIHFKSEERVRELIGLLNKGINTKRKNK